MNPADLTFDPAPPLRVASRPVRVAQRVDDFDFEPIPAVPNTAGVSPVDLTNQFSPIPAYDFAPLENLDDERAELTRRWLGPQGASGPLVPETLSDLNAIRVKAESLGLSLNDVIDDAEEQLSFGDKWAVRLYRNGGPVFRGFAEGVTSVDVLGQNLAYRGLSFIPGWEQLATEADINNRRLAVSHAIADSLNREGPAATFVTPTGASIIGGAAQSLTEIYATAGAAKVGTGAQLTAKGATMLTAGYFGLKRAEQELTVATDHNMSPTMRYAHAGVMGGTEAMFTLLFGSLAGRYGLATAEEAAVVGRPAVARLMQRNGLTEAAAGMVFEGGEEASIEASQMLWGSFVGTDNTDQGFARVAGAFGVGSVTRGALDLPPALRGFKDSYKKSQDALPDVVKGTFEANAAKQENREPNIPEHASEEYKIAVNEQLAYLSQQDSDIRSKLDTVKLGEESLKTRIDTFLKLKSDHESLKKELAALDSGGAKEAKHVADLSAELASADSGMAAEAEAIKARRDELNGRRKKAEFDLKAVESLFAELTDTDKTNIKNKVVETVETKRISSELNASHEALGRAQNSTADSLRKSLGLDELPDADRVTTLESGQRAIAKGIPQRALEISSEIISGKQQLDSDTQSGLVIQQDREVQSYLDLASKRDATPDADGRRAIELQMDAVKSRTDIITQALRRGGTEQARGLAMRRYSPLNPYSVAEAPATGAKAKGSALTAAEDANITNLAIKLATIDDAISMVDRPGAETKPLTDAEFLARELRRASMAKVAKAAQADTNTAEGKLLKEYVAKARAAKQGPLTDAEAAAVVARVRKLVEQNSELALIDRARQQELYDDLDYARDSAMSELSVAIKSLEPRTLSGGLSHAHSLWKSILTGFDGPPIFRQGITKIPSSLMQTPHWWRAFTDKKRAFLQERDILENELYPVAVKHGVGVGGQSSTLGLQDELYLSALANRIRPLGASQRATSLFIRKLRMDSFAAAVRSLGGPSKLTDGELSAIAEFVNISTGRGNLPGFEKSATAMHQLFIGPHFFMSRLQYGLGWPLWKAVVQGNRKAAKLMAKEYGKQVIGLAIMTTLAEQFGAVAFGDENVQFYRNPLDPNFGRLRIGSTMLDITGGVGRPYRYLAGLTEEMRAKADNRPAERRLNKVAGGIAQSALAPAPSAVFAANEAYVGRRDPVDEARNYILPWSINDSAVAMQHEGLSKGGAIAVLQMIGASGFTKEK